MVGLFRSVPLAIASSLSHSLSLLPLCDDRLRVSLYQLGLPLLGEKTCLALGSCTAHTWVRLYFHVLHTLARNRDRTLIVRTNITHTQRPQSSSFWGLPDRILYMKPKKELLWGLWVIMCHSSEGLRVVGFSRTFSRAQVLSDPFLRLDFEQQIQKQRRMSGSPGRTSYLLQMPLRPSTLHPEPEHLTNLRVLKPTLEFEPQNSIPKITPTLKNSGRSSPRLECTSSVQRQQHKSRPE